MRLFFICIILCCFSCANESSQANLEQSEGTTKVDPPVEIPEPEPIVAEPSKLEKSLRDHGLIDVQERDPSFYIDVKYATTDNFMDQILYEDYDKVYLLPDVVDMLVSAHEDLKSKHPKLRFNIYDGTRPRFVQEQMWEKVKGTPFQGYVASPRAGSMHNYGAAIDLGLIHVDTGLVDMGTPYDFFGDEAQPRYEDKFIKEGVLTQAQVDNRRILRVSMLSAGFSGILNEWWHFNAFSRKETREKFTIVP